MNSSTVINSHNEWDPLEEVIVGVVDGATVPSFHIAIEATLPIDQLEFFRSNAGKPFPPERIGAARRDLDEFVHILEAEGVTVRRPQSTSHERTFGGPGWTSSGLYAAMPRDALLIVGDQVIECPMAWRSRYFEMAPYRPLVKEYFRRGARWVAAPKPELSDALYDYSWSEGVTSGDVREVGPSQAFRSVITEYEPTFDAADFMRCGRDIFGQRSMVTNQFGIDWLRAQLGPDYRVHICEFADSHPMHIDATLFPLAPGKLLINPERVRQVPPQFRDWEVFHAPPPAIPRDHTLYMTSKWLNMNILMLDQERVIVERNDEAMFSCFQRWGFKPIRCNFRGFNSFGGSFHCATLDVRRRGTLESYF